MVRPKLSAGAWEKLAVSNLKEIREIAILMKEIKEYAHNIYANAALERIPIIRKHLKSLQKKITLSYTIEVGLDKRLAVLEKELLKLKGGI